MQFLVVLVSCTYVWPIAHKSVLDHYLQDKYIHHP
ncbi:hypothetical protein M3J09_008237 [Ascochyta lentis]